MASRSAFKNTARRSAAKARGGLTPSKAAPLTEAEHRILKAVDVTRLLFEHKDATQIGRRNRDKGFGLLMVHLKAAHQALYRYSNRGAVAGNSDPIFAAMAACERAWAAFEVIAGEEDKIVARLSPIEKRLGVDITTRRPTFEVGIGKVEHEDQIRQFFANERKKGPPAVAITKAQWDASCRKQQAKALSRFRKAQRELRRLQDKHGWTAFENRYEAACNATDDAMLKVARTIPTTHAGLAALAEWASKHYEDHFENRSTEPTPLLLVGIARAAKRLGGGRP